jgi:cytochrome c5
MKLKIIGLAIIAGVIYSCASKSSAVTPTPPATPNKAVVAAPVTEPKPAMVMTAELAAGKTAYENNCAKCHKLFAPKDFSKEDWAPILVSMQKKAHLSDAEMLPITNYIYTQL